MLAVVAEAEDVFIQRQANRLMKTAREIRRERFQTKNISSTVAYVNVLTKKRAFAISSSRGRTYKL